LYFRKKVELEELGSLTDDLFDTDIVCEKAFSSGGKERTPKSFSGKEDLESVTFLAP
jgi:hypothetical protein